MVGRVVVRQSLSGLMYLRTRTERLSKSLFSLVILVEYLFCCTLCSLLDLTDGSLQNYLGHSINAPTGRWQKNKDVHWYNRDVNGNAESKQEELRRIQEAEKEALAVALYVSRFLRTFTL